MNLPGIKDQKQFLPSNSGASTPGIQQAGTLGQGVRSLGQSLYAIGELAYEADAPARAARAKHAQDLATAEQNLTLQEALTDFELDATVLRGKQRQEYVPRSDGEEKPIAGYTKETVQGLKDLMKQEKFAHLSKNPLVQKLFKAGASQYIEKITPDIYRAGTELVVERGQANLGKARERQRMLAEEAITSAGVLVTMDGMRRELDQAIANQIIAPDKAEEMANKFEGEVASSWFHREIGRDPEGLFREIKTPTNRHTMHLLSFLGGKEKTGFTVDHERLVLDGIERKRKEGERNLAETQRVTINKFWGVYFRDPKAAMAYLSDEQNADLEKLPADEYKAMMKAVVEHRDHGGAGNEERTNYWKVQLLQSSTALSDKAILDLPGLNYPQQQELYQAKHTQAAFEEARANNVKHWANDEHYVYYAGKLPESLGMAKLTPITNAADAMVLAQAGIAYRKGYEQLHAKSKGQVPQHAARELMEQIVEFAREDMSFKVEPRGDADRYLDMANLEAKKKAGTISPKDYAQQVEALKALKGQQRAKDRQAEGAPGMAPKRDFKKYGKD